MDIDDKKIKGDGAQEGLDPELEQIIAELNLRLPGIGTEFAGLLGTLPPESRSQIKNLFASNIPLRERTSRMLQIISEAKKS